jgi:MoaA/NifB/PqqE/SkfB family radical SAM enzyme
VSEAGQDAAAAGDPDTFCIMAWTSLMVLPEGVAKVCCAAARVIEDADGPMRLAEHDAEAIWNSAHLRDMRRAMVAGERVDDCASCYIAEAANGASMRTLQNQLHFGDDGAAMAAHRAASARRHHREDSLPAALHLTVSNLCNLTCRMCCSAYSSQIEQHEVLSRWAPPFGDLAGPPAPARLTTRRIGPRPALGVRTAGIAALAADGVAWTTPRAVLDLPIAWFEKPMLLQLAIGSVAPARALRVSVDDRTLFDGTVGGGGAQLDLDVSWLPDAKQMTIALDSDGGVPLRAIDLGLVVADGATRAAGKPGERPSANHNPAIEALLANPRLGHVNFTGGEPMLMPEVGEAIDYLIADGRAGAMSISLATNGTKLDLGLIDKLKRFRMATLFVSIDGVGPVFEYIRPPARWDRVAANLRALTEVFDPMRIFLHPTVQAYNLLDIVEVCRFADALGVNLELLDILVWPRRLMVQVMPAEARRRALARLRRYRADECRPVNTRPVDDLIANLERTMDQHHPELMPEFLRFTAELDQVHGQSFREACPELHELIEAAPVAG